MAIDVSSENKSFKLQRMYQISVSPSKWVKGTDYTLSLRVTDASGAERKAEFGSTVDSKGQTWESTRLSCLFVVGDTVSVTATPDEKLHPDYNPATASKTPTMNDSLSLTCNKLVTVKVTAPEGSTIDAGTLTNYYVYTFLAPVDQSAENGTTATFHFDKNTDYFYRVRHPQGATYWNYVKLSNDADGSFFKGDPGSNFGVYDFSGNPERQKLTVTMTAEGENTFSITLQTTAAGAWDGTTQTEPKTDENGVYQIGTGAELAWFVAKSKDADVSGVLTANINLSKYAWLNISSSKKVELNGAGREITGLNATTGLFAQIGSNSYIHDLTIRGAVSGKGSAGAIVGYACGAGIKIEHCFNYASITSTGNNVGGLVGYTYQNAVIKDCANFGPVTGGSSVGGIIGSTVGNGSTITGCYNTAEISATGSKADGISGEQNGSFNRRLEAGSYTLTLSYVKDAASKGGSDTAYVSVLTLAGMAHVIVENTTFPKAEGAAWDGTTSKTYTVTVSTASLPITVKPATDNTKLASRLPFTDVSTSDWFYDDVKFVYENGLFSGTDSRSFSPSASMTRAMLVTVLYRLEGEPAVAGRSSFADVRSGAYYEKAVIWAAANGIVTGTSSTSFSPDAKVTREQLAAILYRYAQYKNLDTSASEKLSSFSDAGEMSGYANAALGWAVAERLVNDASGKLMPKGYAARAQVAAIFHRSVENVVK